MRGIMKTRDEGRQPEGTMRTKKPVTAPRKLKVRPIKVTFSASIKQEENASVSQSVGQSSRAIINRYIKGSLPPPSTCLPGLRVRQSASNHLAWKIIGWLLGKKQIRVIKKKWTLDQRGREEKGDFDPTLRNRRLLKK